MWLSKSVCRLIFTAILGLASVGFAQSNLPPVISANEATNYLNQEVVVLGKVVQVATRSNIWLLHLDQKYPQSPLNAVIRKSATNVFQNIDKYLGQQVKITGRVVEYRGRLELPLTETNQVKIISPGHAAAPPAPAVSAELAKAVPAAAPSVPVASPPVQKLDEAASGNTLKWILGFVALIAALMGTGILLLWRRPPDRVPASGALVRAADPAPGESTSVEEWKQRALAAEAMAGKQGDILREKMIPELTEFAKQSLVQGLYAQRNVLIETQRKAQLALAEMESRLNTLQAPWQDRIRAYEKRVAELEREVETQGEEMRELTRATLTLVRRKLEDERASLGLPGRFN